MLHTVLEVGARTSGVRAGQCVWVIVSGALSEYPLYQSVCLFCVRVVIYLHTLPFNCVVTYTFFVAVLLASRSFALINRCTVTISWQSLMEQINQCITPSHRILIKYVWGWGQLKSRSAIGQWLIRMMAIDFGSVDRITIRFGHINVI